MNRMIGMAVPGMVAVLAIGTATAAVPASAQQLCKRIQQTSRAWAYQDYNAIKQWPGPGFVHIDDFGNLMRKREWLAWVRKRMGRKHGIISRNILIRTMDSSAVATYEDFIWSAHPGPSRAEHLIMTTVWHRYDGQWKEVSYQTSILFKDKHCTLGKQVHCRVQPTTEAPEVDGRAVPDHVPYVHVEACRFEDISG